VLFGPSTPLQSQAAAAYVSKEQFVSIAPAGAVQVEGQVRLEPGVLAFVDNRGACGIGQS
jgi:hypothetical protein